MQNSEIKKPLDFVNGGDTAIDYVFVDEDGAQIGAGGVQNERYSIVLSPCEGTLAAHSRLSVTARVKALSVGEEQVRMKLVSTNLVHPIEIPIEFSIQVVSGASMLSDGLKRFAMADSSFERFLDCGKEVEELLATDGELWKVLLPPIRLTRGKPSQEPVNCGLEVILV